jgi:hypothetical protein
MASSLDHRAFRETNDNLTQLHDEWMHMSTGTAYHPTEDGYEILPGDMMQKQTLPSNLPPSFTIGFSHSDMQSFMNKLIPPPQHGDNPNVDNPNMQSDGGPAKHRKGPVHRNRGGGGRNNKQHNKGGGGVQGANSLGNVPRLGKVPVPGTGTGTSSSSGSPIMTWLLIGGAGLAVYFIWHKLRKNKAEDKEMDAKGE